MKKIILGLAFSGSLIMLASACNSTKNASETKDSTGTKMDTSMKMTDTTKKVVDTMKKTPPDTTKKQM